MTKVFQDKFGPANGNCMQAAIASLFDLSLEEVPDFGSFGNMWFRSYFNFLKEIGYEYEGCCHNSKRLGYWGDRTLEDHIKECESVNGYYYAYVYSPGLFDRVQYICNPEYKATTHAIIIDKELNVIHDPHPHYQGIVDYPLHERLGNHGILGFDFIEKIEA